MQFLRSKVCTSRIEVGGKPGKSTLDLPLLTQLRIYEVFSSWQIKKREALLFLNSQQSGKKWYFVTKIVLTYCEKKLF